MKFETSNSVLFYDGNAIYNAPASIKIKDTFENRVLVFYKGIEIIHMLDNLEDINHNALMIGKDGNIIWRIMNSSKTYNTFTGLYKVDGQWRASLSEGYEYDLDIETGKISNPKYVGSGFI